MLSFRHNNNNGRHRHNSNLPLIAPRLRNPAFTTGTTLMESLTIIYEMFRTILIFMKPEAIRLVKRRRSNMQFNT